jgi:hypothetical protein
MSHRVLKAMFPLALVACGEKEAPVAAPVAAAADAQSAVPDDADSRKFARALIELSVTDFRPSDASGADFVYSTLDFQDGNRWSAQGYVDAGEERMECTESGAWTMDPATSATSASMTWTLEKTNCPSREAGSEARVEVNLENGFNVAFR